MKAQAKSLAEMVPEPELIRWLALACIAAAILSGLLLGLWELTRPVFGRAQYKVVATPVQQAHSPVQPPATVHADETGFRQGHADSSAMVSKAG